jgi:hypothetical protein
MTSLLESSPPVKPNPAGERELLINLLRTASARTRLYTNTLDTIGVSLRHRQVTTEAAMAWLNQEGLLDLIELGPKGGGR